MRLPSRSAGAMSIRLEKRGNRSEDQTGQRPTWPSVNSSTFVSMADLARRGS